MARKILTWSLVVIAALLLADIAFGKLFDRYMTSRTLPGDYEMTDHVLRAFNEDVAILGSSVALNSINTRTLQDSLGLTAFNAGANGQLFPFYLTTLKAIVAQKAPRHIVLGLIEENLADSGIGQRYNFLAPYYGRDIADIDSVLHGGQATEKAFLHSNFYRLNRIWFRILLYNFASAGIKGENGFVAKPVPPMFPTRVLHPDTLTMSRSRHRELEQFLDICRSNDVAVTVVMTPRYLHPAPESRLIARVRALCGRYGAAFHNDALLEPFRADSTLFYDATHINLNGAEIYTDTIINRLRQQLAK